MVQRGVRQVARSAPESRRFWAALIVLASAWTIPANAVPGECETGPCLFFVRECDKYNTQGINTPEYSKFLNCVCNDQFENVVSCAKVCTTAGNSLGGADIQSALTVRCNNYKAGTIKGVTPVPAPPPGAKGSDLFGATDGCKTAPCLGLANACGKYYPGPTITASTSAQASRYINCFCTEQFENVVSCAKDCTTLKDLPGGRDREAATDACSKYKAGTIPGITPVPAPSPAPSPAGSPPSSSAAKGSDSASGTGASIGFNVGGVSVPPNIGLIVGIAAGGVAVLAVAGTIVYLFRRRDNRGSVGYKVLVVN